MHANSNRRSYILSTLPVRLELGMLRLLRPFVIAVSTLCPCPCHSPATTTVSLSLSLWRPCPSVCIRFPTLGCLSPLSFNHSQAPSDPLLCALAGPCFRYHVPDCNYAALLPFSLLLPALKHAVLEHTACDHAAGLVAQHRANARGFLAHTRLVSWARSLEDRITNSRLIQLLEREAFKVGSIAPETLIERL